MSASTFDKWILDVTFSPRLPPVFCPWDRDRVVTGLSVMRGRCPGTLVGVWHEDGVDAAKAWVEDNPNWRAEYDRIPTEVEDV
jgi:hypothetical protein